MDEKPPRPVRVVPVLERADIGDEPEPGTDPAIRVVKKAMRSELNWQGAKLTVATVVVAVGTAFGAFTFIRNEARAQTDAGMQVETAERKALEVRVQTLEKRFDRFDQKMDAALDALRVPQSARPPPLPDAGR